MISFRSFTRSTKAQDGLSTQRFQAERGPGLEFRRPDSTLVGRVAMTDQEWRDCYELLGTPATPTPLPAITAEPPEVWRPFSDTSPFNRKITANHVTELPNSKEIIARLLALHGGPAKIDVRPTHSEAGYNHPYYFAKDSDPKYRIVGSGSF